MSTTYRSIVRLFLIILLSLGIGAVCILMIGENPVDAYIALFKGAFIGKLNFGNTLANFTPLLLTAIAFAVAAKGGAFNVGVEGEVFLGGITAAYIGIHWSFLPAPIHILACFTGAVVVASLWALIPGILKAYYAVNEVCTTILMNYVAIYLTSYLVSGPMSAGVANSQSLPVAEQVKLYQFMQPSSANVGILIAIAVTLLTIWMLMKTTLGYKIRTVGTNPQHAEYAGINPKRVFIQAMMLSGALGGIAGCIEVLGVHGYFLDNSAAGLGTNGMLAALIVKSNVVLAPFMSFFLGALNSGALGLQQSTGVPKSIIDTIAATFIIIATMDMLFQFTKKKKSEKQSIKSDVK